MQTLPDMRGQLPALRGRGVALEYHLALSPLHAATGRFVPCALAHFSPFACGHAIGRYGTRTVRRDYLVQMEGRAAAGDVLAVSPAPPSRENQPEAFGEPSSAGGAHRFSQWGNSGSAANPWKTAVRSAKSLIPQANRPTSWPCDSTGYAVFSTDRVSAARPAAPSFSLSKSLKEKKKERGEKQAGRAQGHPRVEGVFPRVRTPAYFFIHGFHRSERANPWKSVERKAFAINDLGAEEWASTDPRVALRVVPPHAKEIGYNGGTQ